MRETLINAIYEGATKACEDSVIRTLDLNIEFGTILYNDEMHSYINVSNFDEKLITFTMPTTLFLLCETQIKKLLKDY